MDINPNEYYYPINTTESNQTFNKYKSLSKRIENVSFCGRSGLFRYIDMIPAVQIHLEIAYKFIKSF